MMLIGLAGIYGRLSRQIIMPVSINIEMFFLECLKRPEVMKMGNFIGGVQPVVKKETKRVAMITAIGVACMWVVFAALHFFIWDKVPFDYTVVLGGIGGGIVAVLNFFLMGIIVQKVASVQEEDRARAMMKASYSRRMLFQMLWVVAAIVAPCFQFAAGIAPLFFPSLGIKALGITNRIT